MRPISRLICVLGGTILVVGCGGNDGIPSLGTGGAQSRGGNAATSVPNVGGTQATGGSNSGIGGKSAEATGGRVGEGGTANPSSGGTTSGRGGSTTGVGSTTSSGGSVATGGVSNATGGSTPKTTATGGAATGGGKAAGGTTATGGAATGGKAAGGAATGGTKANTTVPTAGASSTSSLDCSALPAMPTGGSDHCGQNTRGTAGGQNWELWCNSLSSSACMTTFSTTAFSARWNNNSDFLARVGLEFGNSGKSYDQYGTLKADFAFTKTGNGGGFSYIGIYGWTTNPCVEWYIVDDRYGTMPFNAYNATQKGTATIDGESYKLFQNKTTGTGGSRCSGVNQWDQYWSIRQRARQCGTITISEHFKAWEAAGLPMGGLLEAKILVETGGGTGNIDFPVAKVTAQ